MCCNPVQVQVSGLWLPGPMGQANFWPYRNITAGNIDESFTSDGVIWWNSPVSTEKTENLVAGNTYGQVFGIMDLYGNAGTYNINLIAPKGFTINGQPNYAIEASGAVVWIMWTPNGYNIVSAYRVDWSLS